MFFCFNAQISFLTSFNNSKKNVRKKCFKGKKLKWHVNCQIDDQAHGFFLNQWFISIRILLDERMSYANISKRYNS